VALSAETVMVIVPPETKLVASFGVKVPVITEVPLLTTVALLVLIITTDVGSIKDHVSEKNGLIIHTNNTETISKVQEYLDLLKNNTELLLKISLYNREYAIAYFAYSQFEKKYNELLSLG
jgi:glycosyltransferase involved in cell wall biosynthesis